MNRPFRDRFQVSALGGVVGSVEPLWPHWRVRPARWVRCGMHAAVECGYPAPAIDWPTVLPVRGEVPWE